MGIYGERYTDDLFMGTVDVVGIECCMDATDFWRVEDNNNSKTHHQEILRKVHM
jgi:hypothetical protein